jgi:Protein of unknown function (DUF4446)
MDSDLAGIIAIGAAALALAGLLVSALLAVRLRRIRATHETIAGAHGERTLAEHAVEIDRRLAELGQKLSESLESLNRHNEQLDTRLQGAITQCGLVRYDAMGEMTGRQSSSIALLDSRGTGVVLSSILHREQARLYAKPVTEGSSEFELSPEEHEALETAMRK